MPSYKAPVEDYQFLLHDWLRVEECEDLPQRAELDRDTTQSLLESAAQFFEKTLQPLNQLGDTQGCRYEDGQVRTPDGFPAAYRQYVAGGWNALELPTEIGGADMPPVIGALFHEMTSASNHALGMYWLAPAACQSIWTLGDEWMKRYVAPKLTSGEWTATMCLTEAHCGSDLKLLRTKAVAQSDGTFRISGSKIFISGGDHDLTDNIIHMVIAKLPDDDGKLRDDLATVNYFMVPKILVDTQTGALLGRNAVSVGSIEKKMGIKGSATCVLNFDDAVAYRISGGKGTKSANMAGMFLMMNAVRLSTGILGVAIADVAYQNAAMYARERRSGRAPSGVKDPSKSADPIIVHPDVRRLLLSSASFAEGARATAFWIALQQSIATHAADPQARNDAEDLLQLMTPVMKAYFTDKGFDAANACMQVFGGHGYVHEHGMEQFVRDVRIGQQYEGANGIQAIDLVARKMTAQGGRAIQTFMRQLEEYIATSQEEVGALRTAAADLRQALDIVREHSRRDPNFQPAVAYDVLTLLGVVTLGWTWSRLAAVARQKLDGGDANAAFYRRKLVLSRYWMEKELPYSATLLTKIRTGGEVLMALADEEF